MCRKVFLILDLNYKCVTISVGLVITMDCQSVINHWFWTMHTACSMHRTGTKCWQSTSPQTWSSTRQTAVCMVREMSDTEADTGTQEQVHYSSSLKGPSTSIRQSCFSHWTECVLLRCAAESDEQRSELTALQWSLQLFPTGFGCWSHDSTGPNHLCLQHAAGFIDCVQQKRSHTS